MRCPKCGGTQTKVLDSRFVESYNQIRRRRECENCGYRFTTFEKIALTDLLVEKKDGSTEYYSRDKLRNSLITAFAKRPISDSDIDKIISELEEKWSSKKKITTRQI
jgi:transcriptional repressor NrdR